MGLTKDVLHECLSKNRRSAVGNIIRESGCEDQIVDFLNNAGYTELGIAGAGSNSITLKVDNTLDQVIRLSPRNHEARAAIPQLVQPVNWHQSQEITFAKKEVRLEVLRNISAHTEAEKHRVKEGSRAYEAEVHNYGEDYYVVRNADFSDDAGLFLHGGRHYIMGMDPGLINLPIPKLVAVFKDRTALTPLCSSNYITLQPQWEYWRHAMKEDDRLQRLIGAREPMRFPESNIIRVAQPGQKK